MLHTEYHAKRKHSFSGIIFIISNGIFIRSLKYVFEYKTLLKFVELNADEEVVKQFKALLQKLKKVYS